MSDFKSFKSVQDYDLLIDLDDISMITPDGICCYIILKSGVEVRVKQSYDEVCNILFRKEQRRQMLNE